MLLTSDYHTHTVFSHGKGTIEENAIMAAKLNLKELGISDHGFAHPVFGLTKKKLPKMRSLCDEATKKTGVKVLLGIESNIIGTDGTVDLKPKLYDYFDVFLAGIHKFVLYKFKSIFSLACPNLFCSTFNKKEISKKLIKTNTKTIINVIKNNPVDVITHLNFCSFTDVKEIAKACQDYGTYIELNAKKIHLTEQELQTLADTDVRFVINSDAHTPLRVGEISLIEKQLEKIKFPLDRIDNIDGRLPKFRFSNFKKGV